jgi:hypothetical protein
MGGIMTHSGVKIYNLFCQTYFVFGEYLSNIERGNSIVKHLFFYGIAEGTTDMGKGQNSGVRSWLQDTFDDS